MVQSIFTYLKPFRRDLQVWQTDRRTDGQTRSSQMPRFTTLRGQTHSLYTRLIG